VQESGANRVVCQLSQLFRFADEVRRKVARLMIFKPYNAYMDESGTHDGSRVVALAGYVSTYEAWNDFEIEWNRVMQHGRSKIFT